MQKFSAHFANWYSVMESAANVDLDDSEPGPWPNLRTMFQYKGKTENSVKFSCLRHSSGQMQLEKYLAGRSGDLSALSAAQAVRQTEHCAASKCCMRAAFQHSWFDFHPEAGPHR